MPNAQQRTMALINKSVELRSREDWERLAAKEKFDYRGQLAFMEQFLDEQQLWTKFAAFAEFEVAKDHAEANAD